MLWGIRCHVIWCSMGRWCHFLCVMCIFVKHFVHYSGIFHFACLFQCMTYLIAVVYSILCVNVNAHIGGVTQRPKILPWKDFSRDFFKGFFCATPPYMCKSIEMNIQRLRHCMLTTRWYSLWGRVMHVKVQGCLQYFGRALCNSDTSRCSLGFLNTELCPSSSNLGIIWSNKIYYLPMA